MIKLAYDVGRYRSLLADTVRRGDVVLEIGPHVGKSTLAYMEKASKIVLVDKGLDCLDMLEELESGNDKVSLVVGDARGFDAMKLTLQHIQECGVFAVDMGGGRYPDTVFKVWATWAGVFKPRDTVIRNRGLIEFVKRAKVEDDKMPEEFEESGWLSEYGRSTPYKLKKQLEEFTHWIDINQPLD